MGFYNTTVGDLREIAQDILDQLDGYDDDLRIKCRPNTYNMSETVLETGAGFIDYRDIEIDYDNDDGDYDGDYDLKSFKERMRSKKQSRFVPLLKRLK